MSTAHVILSPHPDDAVWSVGGRMACWARDGASVTVVTVFDGDPPGAAADRPVPDGSVDPRIRRAEDAVAVARLGARRVSLGLPDAALRTGGGMPVYRTRLRLFGPVAPADCGLPRVVSAAVSAVLAPDATLHLPLAAGRHVDHVLTRAAGEWVAARRTAYYEEFPYWVRERDHDGLVATAEPADVTAWTRAARRYHSQVLAMFGTRTRFDDAFLAVVRARSAVSGAECTDRFWIKADRRTARASPVPDIPRKGEIRNADTPG